MCGRFGSNFTAEDLATRFGITNAVSLNTSYNIAPSYYIPAIIKNGSKKVSLMKWGFIPHWAQPSLTKIAPINARGDSLEKPYYKDAFTNTRCIIPFSWFYEWKKTNLQGKQIKTPYLIKVKKQKIMGFAGIYSKHEDAEKHPFYTCAIITTTPNSLIKTIHNRMPVILPKENEEDWLKDKINKNFLLKLIKPFPPEKMESYRISKDVNSPNNDSVDIIKPLK